MDLRKIMAGLAFLAILFVAGPARAGTLCGTVRDAQSGSPVPAAGVFVRTTAGAYTGLYAATDSQGRFCIDPIPAGAYDLEVRVDDYLVATVTGVVVGQQTGIGIDVPSDRLLRLSLWPNPAMRDLNLEWSLPRDSDVRIGVFDVQGRVVAGWSGNQSAGSHAFTWDLKDIEGRVVPPGIYFVRLQAGNTVRVGRVIRLK